MVDSEKGQTRIAENENFLKTFGSQSKSYRSYSSGLLTGQPGGSSAIQGMGVFNFGALKSRRVGSNEKISRFKEIFEKGGSLGSLYLYSEGQISKPFEMFEREAGQRVKDNQALNDNIETIYKDVVDRWLPTVQPTNENKEISNNLISEITNSVFGDKPGDGAGAVSTNPIKAVITYSNSMHFTILNDYLEELAMFSDEVDKGDQDSESIDPATTQPSAPARSDKDLGSEALYSGSSFGGNVEELINILTAHKMFVNSIANALNQILLIDKSVSENSDYIARKPTNEEKASKDFELNLNKALQSFSIKHECLGAISMLDEMLSSYKVRMFKFIQYFNNYNLEFNYKQINQDNSEEAVTYRPKTTRGLHQKVSR